MRHSAKFTRTAFVVEDDKVFRKLYVRCLMAADSGLRIVEAHNGFSALSCMLEHTPDLVLLDLHMPGFDGFEYIHIVKGKPQFSDMPIIVITSARDDRTQALRNLPNVFLFGKPIKSSLLDQIIRSTLGKKSRTNDLTGHQKTTELDRYMGADPALQRELVYLFYTLVPERIAEIQYCLDRGEFNHLRDWCHAMRGTASILDAKRLAALTEELSQAVKSDATEKIRELIDWIIVELRRLAVDLYQRFDLAAMERIAIPPD